MMMKVHERIRQYIESNGMKLNFVAEKSGIHQKKFYRLLNGNTPLDVEEFEAICKNGLSVEPSYFFGENFSFIENKTSSSA